MFPGLPHSFPARRASYLDGRLDYDAALTAFATAQLLRPNDAGAMAAASYVYRRQGLIVDAIRKQEEALDHDPRNTRFVANQAANYMMVRRYADAARAGPRTLGLDPYTATAPGWLRSASL